MTKIKVWN